MLQSGSEAPTNAHKYSPYAKAVNLVNLLSLMRRTTDAEYFIRMTKRFMAH